MNRKEILVYLYGYLSCLNSMDEISNDKLQQLVPIIEGFKKRLEKLGEKPNGQIELIDKTIGEVIDELLEKEDSNEYWREEYWKDFNRDFFQDGMTI